MSVEGLEPPTNGLKGHCSTIELHARYRRGFYHVPTFKSTGEGEHCVFRWGRRDRDEETGQAPPETGFDQDRFYLYHRLSSLSTQY